MDISQTVAYFSVEDIHTPFGLLRDTIPLPGDVILEMAASIETVRSQFPPHILVGPPAALTFYVDEGRGFSESQEVPITNDGIFGSLLSVTFATSADYVQASPISLGGISSNDSGVLSVSVNSLNLLASSSPLSETVSVQSSESSNSPVSLPVNIVIRPKATIVLSTSILEFSVSHPLTGPFPTIPSQQFVITNNGLSGSVLDFQVQRLTNLSSTWLKVFSPVSGTLSSGSTQAVIVTVAPDSNLSLGTYTETLRISGYSTNSYVDVQVQLTIS